MVVLTDMTAGAPVSYSIGEAVRDPVTYAETIDLTPVTPFAANRWYRVTVSPGESQSGWST